MSSSIKTTQIDGDVSVGRNVAVGGKVTVQGGGHIKGTLKVDGWLDAKNIKGANKGVFTTIDKLRGAYPMPHDGWWAIVGGTLPGDIYVGDGGEWVATGEQGGNPTVDSEQYNEAVAELQADMAVMQQDISDLDKKNESQDADITLLKQSATSTNEAAAKAQQTADTAVGNAAAVASDLANFKGTKGAAGGIAPLDSNGIIPSKHLPSYVDDAIEFGGTVSRITVSVEAGSSSTDTGCSVVYNKDTNRFILAVAETQEDESVLVTYYKDWSDASAYGVSDSVGVCPESGKVFIDKQTNKTYRWSGSTLVTIGSDLALGYTGSTAFPGNEGAALQEAVLARNVINVNRLLDADLHNFTFAVVLDRIQNLPNSDDFIYPGIVLSFLTAEGWVSKQWVNTDDWHNEDNWANFGSGNAAVGNCYNVTNEQPIAGYYDLETAIAATYAKALATVGMQITFAIAASSWKTYQFVGNSVTEENFSNIYNWIDLAGMSAGEETFINVDAMCGNCADAAFYNLSYAISAINALQNSTGITYAKGGLVITYKIADYQWETKQFTGAASDFGSVELWKDFGSGSASQVELGDEPEENGEKAFSTKGAYSHMPTTLGVDTETEGVVKLSMKNAAGEMVGDEVQFMVGTGTGDSSGTIVSITPKESPLYAQAGGTVLLKAAIRSITAQGAQEQSNMIERVELLDRDTNQLLETYNVNKASSADADTFDFEFDLSAYFTQASQRRFKLTAYDDSDHSGSRNINVTAVDVTVQSEQTLNYTSSTVVSVGGNTKSLVMYKFPNNASDKGILCTVEIFIDGEWHTLGTATISDTYTHNITVNPNDCCGKVLAHGAYPIRIHGEDIASGVVGNYLHTSIMVAEAGNNTPIVATRWYSETQSGTIKQYDTISLDFAVYKADVSTVQAQVIDLANNSAKQETSAQRAKTYTYTERVEGVDTDGSVMLQRAVKAISTVSSTAEWRVEGSLIDIEAVTSMLVFDMDVRTRSNSDTDKTITDGGHELTVNGANYTTNGFVKDTFGTGEYGTANDSGVMGLRIAENVTAHLDYAPFNNNSIPTNGTAIQFRIRVKNVANDDARFISCMQDGRGFYVTGKRVVFTTDNGVDRRYTATADLEDDAITDVAIVIEPMSQAPYGGIGTVKIYLDGEVAGTCEYNEAMCPNHATEIDLSGVEGDLYLYNIRAWETFFSYEQSFNNYLLKMHDAVAMIKEYEFNQVMAPQAAEGKPATNRPQATALGESGLPYVIITKTGATDPLDPKNHIDYIEGLKGDKKTEVRGDWYVFFPGERWRNFIIYDTPTTNQGTTSSMRPIKNKRTKAKKCKKIVMMYTLEQMPELTPEQIAEYNLLAAMAAQKKVQIKRGTMFTNVLCIKVDYSDSGGAHNGASTNLYNDLTRALGSEYMTPAQVFSEEDYPIEPCIQSIPIGLFRTDQYSTDATLPGNAYFHAKGNLNYDKSDAGVFGFENVKGYNKDCLNYGDFYELIAARDQSLEDFATAQNKGTWEFPIDPDDLSEGYHDVVVLSEFCGPNHKIYRKIDGAWTETTGTMTFANGKWTVTGDVVNPVENFEIKVYNSMAWFQGVNSLDDMLALDGDGVPVWLQYFESRYPDNDDLNAAYEEGRKVPYTLYQWLRWCQDCNQNLTEADGDISIDGVTVSGTAENRLLKFKRELHKVANVKSCVCYHIATDYLNAVDQRSKNMMVGFYLDTDGVMRMYLNHMYDGDCLWGSDNDCGITIPVELDPNNDTAGYFQGHDSVIFRQIYRSDYIWLKDYESDSDISDSSKATTVAAICKAMREAKVTNSGGTFNPFSIDGVERYWVTDRLSKYPKLVSSYDGLRKYVENSVVGDNYFYALHGLSIQRLRQYVSTRFRFRDSFYGCGDLFAAPMQLRGTGQDMSITVTAAKDGFFALGVDQAAGYKEGLYLKAGETHTFESGASSDAGGYMLYLFGADRAGVIDLSNVTPKAAGWDISQLKFLKKLIIGGENYTAPADSSVLNEVLKTLDLGQLPFLEELDVRNFPISTINAEYCPRLKSVKASGSRLTRITLAQTSPITTLDLPATMQTLSFVNLPNLTYPNGGLTIEGFADVKTFELSGCPGIDAKTIMEDAIEDGASIKYVHITDNISADDTVLAALKASGAVGIGSDLSGACDGLTGRWILTKLIDDSLLQEYQDYFPELELYNAQYSCVVFDDNVEFNDTQNITNLENGTHGENYVASGHFKAIEAMSHAYKCLHNPSAKKMVCTQLSDNTYTELADGTSFDPSDTVGEGYDVMKLLPEYWYKGVNDYKNQKKYLFASSNADEPLSTAMNIRRCRLGDLLIEGGSSMALWTNTDGVNYLQEGDDYELTSNGSMDVYAMNVDGMKQVRFLGVNSQYIGAVFVDKNNKVVSTFNMYVSNGMFDFVPGDYVFCDVPKRAARLLFTGYKNNDNAEIIAVDSAEIEAIEPDWVRTNERLVGVYGLSVDAAGLPRSISGKKALCGTGTSTTSGEWKYDADGKVTNIIPPTSLNYTMKDFMNLCEMRGEGFQAIDYEMSKDIANIVMALTGDRDVQAQCGAGCSSSYTTGAHNSKGNQTWLKINGSITGNLIFGIQNFVACNVEWMDNVAINVQSFANAKKYRLVSQSGDVVDHVWHIYDPTTGTERTVQGINASDSDIARVKFGRFCDIIASKLSGNNDHNKWYSDVQWYSAASCRAVLRSYFNAYASSGLVCASAVNASSYSHTHFGSRLAFCGEIEIVK